MIHVFREYFRCSRYSFNYAFAQNDELFLQHVYFMI